MSIPLDALKVRPDDVADGHLALSGGIHEMTVAIDVDTNPVGFDAWINERMVSLKVVLQVQDGLSNLLQREAIVPSKGEENVGLNQVDERKGVVVQIRRNQRGRVAGPAKKPASDCGDRRGHEARDISALVKRAIGRIWNEVVLRGQLRR